MILVIGFSTVFFISVYTNIWTKEIDKRYIERDEEEVMILL
jgi:hypothetical protein